MSLYGDSDRFRIAEVRSGSDKNAEPYRTDWRRDYARLIHSASFRRLQGKTQLFPGLDSDFFRNRLTHSLEVAQVAKSLAHRINDTIEPFKNDPISHDIVEIAALSHDLGHPPFGHNGEKALDDCMKRFGGFEGNAQTLRILAKLEKKETVEYNNDSPILFDSAGRDRRAGLNLTYRVLASVLKYDSRIPIQRTKKAELKKGYYTDEAHLVKVIKESIIGKNSSRKLKTIECSIMDIADDIAYSTYDLEDAFKAEFLTPTSILSADEALLNDVAKKVRNKLKENFGNQYSSLSSFTAKDVLDTLLGIFKEFFDVSTQKKRGKYILDPTNYANVAAISTQASRASSKLTSDGYTRTGFTSKLVNDFIHGVRVHVRKPISISQAYLDVEVLKKVEVLKNFTYASIIMSPRLKTVEHRGYGIVKSIFDTLSSSDGLFLLPADFQHLLSFPKNKATKMRIICDFVAGMTDRYAVEFYCRLNSENPQTIFKPF